MQRHMEDTDDQGAGVFIQLLCGVLVPFFFFSSQIIFFTNYPNYFAFIPHPAPYGILY